MLTRLEFKLTIPQSMQRVLQVDLAFDGSFVVLASSRRGEAIMHYTNKNQLLSCYNYPLGQVNMFSMLNSAEVWVPLPRSSELTTIDLRSKVISGMKYDFMRKDFNDLQIFTFHESKLVCIKETSHPIRSEQLCKNPSKVGLRLRYIFPRLFGDSEMIQHESKEGEYLRFCRLNNTNHHSLVIWFGQYFVDFFELFTCELVREKGQLKKQVQCLRLDAFAGMPESMMPNVGFVWQAGGNRGKEGRRLLALDSLSLHPQAQEHFLYKIDVCQRSIQTCLLDHGQYYPQRIYLLNSHAVVYSRYQSHQSGSLQESQDSSLKKKMSLVSHYSEQLSGKVSLDDVDHREVFVAGDGGKLIELAYDFQCPSQYWVVVRQAIEPRQMYLQMLLRLNEDFDDDLLSDAMELLGCLAIEEEA